MILDLDRLRMEYAKIYQVDEGSARREPLGGSLSLNSRQASLMHHFFA